MELTKRAVKRWLAIFILSFAMYEALWAIIELQFGDLTFDKDDLIWNPIQCSVFTFVVFVVNWFFKHFKDGRYNNGYVEIACIIFINALIIFLTNRYFFEQDSKDDDFWNVIDIYIICIICSAISIIDIQHNYHIRFVEIQQKQMRLRLNLLQQQLSPHFMFNSLNLLQGLVATNPQMADEYIVTLSDILRYITTNIGKEKVALKDAVGFIKNYTKMLGARFPKHFALNIADSDIPTNACIIPVSLQIAVENAIKHNKHSSKQPLDISVTFDKEYAIVTNGKQQAVNDEGLGIGLENLSQRYKLLVGKALEINEDDNHYSVKIPLIYESLNSRR